MTICKQDCGQYCTGSEMPQGDYLRNTLWLLARSRLALLFLFAHYTRYVYKFIPSHSISLFLPRPSLNLFQSIPQLARSLSSDLCRTANFCPSSSRADPLSRSTSLTLSCHPSVHRLHTSSQTDVVVINL